MTVGFLRTYDAKWNVPKELPQAVQVSTNKAIGIDEDCLLKRRVFIHIHLLHVAVAAKLRHKTDAWIKHTSE